jgi:hypothetical protein
VSAKARTRSASAAVAALAALLAARPGEAQLSLQAAVDADGGRISQGGAAAATQSALAGTYATRS